MTSSAAHENGLKQKLTNLLETIGRAAHPSPGASLWLARKVEGEGGGEMNSWVTFFWPLRGMPIVRVAGVTCVSSQ